MSEVLAKAREAAENEGKNIFRPHILNPHRASMVERIAGVVYEALWMEERLQYEKWRREETIALAVKTEVDPNSEYASLMEGEKWIKAIRVGEVVAVVPAAMVLVAYLLKGKGQN